jgi:MoaA/NifB/PqqE/SkfB family radical SAM enzyme
MKIMNFNYQLKNVILRKEYFGGLIASLDDKTYYQINDDGYNILRLMTEPIDLQSLHQTLNKEYDFTKSDLFEFIKKMSEIGVVSNENNSYYSKIFFDNIKECPQDHLNAPTSVSIYITQFCPKECKHCITRSSPYVDRSRELRTEQWKKVIDKLREYGCLSIVFTGGDCLSRKDIFEIIEYAEHQKFMIAILTDYDDINTEHLELISKLKNLIDVQISLDGGTPTNHNWLRGEGSFEKCLKRMQKLRDYGIEFTVASAIYNKNCNEIDKIASICREYGANNLYINPLCPYGRGVNMKENLLTKDQLYELSQKYLKLIKDKKISSGNPFWEENIDKIGDLEFNPFSNKYDHVSTGFFNIAINWQGDCYLDSKFGSEKTLCIGNAYRDEFNSIWNNKVLCDIRKKYQETGNVFINKFDLLGSG